MNGYNQQQGQLPADPTQAQFQPPFVDFNNPPPIPNYQCSPDVANWLSAIATMCAMEIQNNYQKNPLRMFTFNLFARNGYNTQEFFRLVMAAGDWLDMGMSQNRFPSPEAAINQIAPQMVEMVVSAQLRNYPALAGYIDQQLGNAAMQAVQRLDNLAGEIERFKGMQQQGMQRQMQPQGGGGQSWAQGAMGAMHNVGEMAWGGNQGWMGGGRPNVQTSMRGGGGQELFQERQQKPSWGGQRGTQEEDGREARFRRRASAVAQDVGEISSNQDYGGVERVQRPTSRSWSRGVETTPAVQQPPEPEPIRAKEEKHSDLLAEESGLKWTPSERQAYALSYNPTTHLLYHRQTADGAVIEVLKERTEGSMDYEKHRIPRLFGPAGRRTDLAKQRQKQAELQAMLTSPYSADSEDLTDEQRAALQDRVDNPAWIIETGQDNGWIVGMVGRYASTEDGHKPYVYHRRAKIARAVVDDVDQKAFLAELAACTTYAELRMKFMGLGEKMNPELWRMCERKITRAVNRVLNQQLSIPRISIESFIEDVADLPEYLKGKFGTVVTEAFLENQERSIRTTFEVLGEEFAEEEKIISENFLTEYAVTSEDGPKFTYLVSSVSMTFVNCLVQELEVELNPSNAAMITSTTPFLKALAADIMEVVCADDEFDRHFIRTRDGAVLELTEGLIGSKAYLLKLIEQ